MVTKASIDRYVVDVLVRDLVGHDGRPAAYILYLYVLTRPQRRVQLSLASLASGTGLSKRAVQLSVAWLEDRSLLEVVRTGPTAIPTYRALRPWRR
ncbi:MAG TPA: hypothetical protein VMF61_10660 [Candidatus Acidoferrales bacterium]|nr:hypothetical protein [Candidatus Acidoferrales bacterium]